MSARTPDDSILQRVYGEFLEMPGLRLTSHQAQRLWGLDEQMCRNILDMLVEANFLRVERGAYSRASDGFAERPRLRMASARDAGASFRTRQANARRRM